MSLAAEQILESKPRADWFSVSRPSLGAGLKKLTFSYEGSCSNNRKSDPETVHDTAKKRDDFVAEKGWE